MIKKILFDTKEFHFHTDNLPILIHGEDKAGASLFTVSTVADMYSRGAKILFLSGYPMAREEFLKQTEMNNDYAVITDKLVTENLQKRVLFLTKEYAEQFIQLIALLPDIDERIILLKNIDLFDESIFTAISNKTKIIYSGDITKTVFIEKLLQLPFKTKIFFSPFNTIVLPTLDNYQGYMQSIDGNGLVGLAAI